MNQLKLESGSQFHRFFTMKKEQDNYKDIQVIRKLDNTMVQHNYLQIKPDSGYYLFRNVKAAE